jgi:tRNA nucleotidyltransferase (CCA-adding enzyme)
MKYIDAGIEIVKRIESLGYQAYVVGGAVRDMLLNVETNDVDITTNMPIDEIKKHFNTKDTGSDFFSVTIYYLDNYYEITNFRYDMAYYDHRHPDVGLVTNYYEDSKRRDFTINALALDSNHNVIDYHNGLDDLNKHIIRAIGVADKRFQEDALRILRALYFSSKLDFEIEEGTLAAIIKNKKLLAKLSHERIIYYVIKLLYSKTNRGIDYINKYDLFEFIPDYKLYLSNFKKEFDVKDINIYYYYFNKKIPPFAKKDEKRLMEKLDLLMNSNFDNYVLFNNYNYYVRLKDVLRNIGIDTHNIDVRINNFKIRSIKDLAISSEEIAKKYNGSKIKEAIDLIITNILNDKLSNDYDSIIKFLKDVQI